MTKSNVKRRNRTGSGRDTHRASLSYYFLDNPKQFGKTLTCKKKKAVCGRIHFIIIFYVVHVPETIYNFKAFLKLCPHMYSIQKQKELWSS